MFKEWTTHEKEKFEDTKGLIRSRKSEARRYNGQKKTYKNDLQNITQKTKNRASRTLPKTGGEHACSGKGN